MVTLVLIYHGKVFINIKEMGLINAVKMLFSMADINELLEWMALLALLVLQVTVPSSSTSTVLPMFVIYDLCLLILSRTAIPP